MTPETLLREGDHRSSREIESDIREKRERMDSTLDQLGERLNVRSLVNSALEWWDSPSAGNQGSVAVRRAVRTVATQMKHHPMPSLLIGGGLAWLIADAAGDDGDPPPQHPGEPSRVSDRLRTTNSGGIAGSLEHAKEAASGVLESAQEKISDLGSRTHRSVDHLAHEAYVVGRSAVHKISHEVKEDYRAAGKRFGRAADENPLALGVAFVALGALAGLALPRSRKEDELMGEKSDHLVEAAKEKGEEILESGKAVGERVMDTVVEEAKEQGLTADKVTGALSSLAEKGSAILQKAKDEASQAAEENGLKPPAPAAAPQEGTAGQEAPR